MKRLVFLSLIAILSWTAAAADEVSLPGPLVSAKWLNDNLQNVVILDVREDTQSFTARPIYTLNKTTGSKRLVKVAAHIPGAVLVDYRKVRSKRLIDGNNVELMVPEADEFSGLMQKSGVRQDSNIVIVSKGMTNLDMTMAARLYWQLKYYGHDKVAILNGGMAAWLDAGFDATTQMAEVKSGDWEAGSPRQAIYAESADVEAAIKAGNVQLVDARPLGQYLGLHKPSFVYAYGHIPGAVSYPNELLTMAPAPAFFFDKEMVLKILKQVGIDPDKPTITYGNSGHLAAGSWFILHELLGNKNVRLYDGSMHEWTLEKHQVEGLR